MRSPAFSLTSVVIPQSRTREDADSATLLRTMTSIPIMAAMLLFPAVVIVLGPSAADHYTLVGALVAAIMTLVAVRKYDQSVWNGICAFLGALFVGITAPGSLISWLEYKQWITEDTYQFITWHSWTALGLVFGLGGWVAAQSVYQTFSKLIPGFFARLGEKLDRLFK